MKLFAFGYAFVVFAYGALGIGLFALRRERALGLAAILTALWAASLIEAPLFQDTAWFVQAAGWAGLVGTSDRRFRTRPLSTAVSNDYGRRSKVQLATFGIIVFCILVAAYAGFGTHFEWLQSGGVIIEARLFVALSILILIENVYRNAPDDLHWHLNLPLIAVATMAIFTFLLYGDAIIHRHLSISLLAAQALVYLIVLPLFIGSERRMRRWQRRVSLSHGAAFYTSTLMLGGSVLVGLGLAGTLLGHYGTSWGPVVEVALVFLGIVVVLVLASSGSARSRLRRMIADNFFAQRYDYRAEWLRCIETLAAIEQGGLPQRVIKVLADTIDSPAGVLMLRDDSSEQLVLANAGEWNMRGPPTHLNGDHPVVPYLIRQGYCRIGAAHQGIDSVAVDTTPDCWLAFALPDPRSSVPLGAILLSAPRSGESSNVLNEEAIALLHVVAGEIALMLAERRAAEALAEARRFAAAGQRFAFVAHDIKNVANQLALLVSNADQHIDDPDFRDDMMATLRGSVGKIQSMLARLKSPDLVPVVQINVADRLRRLVAESWSKNHVSVVLDIEDAGDIAIEPAAFDAVMNHLIENAIEASSAGQIVSVRAISNEATVTITITDRGAGMSDQFMRDQLFRPFISSKAGGFGLGAFQARELVHAANGTVAISSTVGEGTVVSLSFPALVAPARDAALVSA